MRNLGRGTGGVLGIALRQPGSAQVILCNHAVTGTGYLFRYGFVLCIVVGCKFRRLVYLVSLCYVLF